MWKTNFHKMEKKRVIVNSILQWSLFTMATLGTEESGHCRSSFSFDWEDTCISHYQDNVGFLIWLATWAGESEPNPALWAGQWDGTILRARGDPCVPQGKFPRKPCNKFASLWISTPSRYINTPKKRTWPISSYLDRIVNVTLIPSSIFWFACHCYS